MRSRILELLRKAGEEYMSGEEIAKRLGVSRTAVWKHIKELREAGYGIKSRSRSGYALEETPDCLLPGEIKNGLRTRFIAIATATAARSVHFGASCGRMCGRRITENQMPFPAGEKYDRSKRPRPFPCDSATTTVPAAAPFCASCFAT